MQDPTADGFDVRSLALTYREGHEVRPHTHPWAQLLYASSGLMHVAADRRIWMVPPTRAVWVPPGVVHGITFKGEVAMRTLYLSPGRAHTIQRGVETLEVTPLLFHVIQHIHTHGMLNPCVAEHDHLAQVLVDLIVSARGMDMALPQPKDDRAARLALYLRAHPSSKSDLDTLSSRAGASLRTMQRCFLRDTGLTLDAWRQKARLVHGMAALSAGASVTDAALNCGYDNPSAFIAAFKKQFGVTPGRFRDQGRRAAVPPHIN